VAYSVTGKTFLPTMDEGSVIVQLTKAPSISLAHSLEDDQGAARDPGQGARGDRVIARTGSDELGLDPMGLNETDSFLKLKPRSEWRVGDKAWVVDQIRRALADLPGIQTSYTQPIEMRVSEMLTGARGDLAIKVFGPDNAELARIAGEIQARLKAIPGTSEALTMANDKVDYLQIDIDRIAAGRAGMPIDQLQDAMRAQVEGVRAGVVADGLRRVPILIRGRAERRANPARLCRPDLSQPHRPAGARQRCGPVSASPGRSSWSMRTARALPWCRPCVGAIWSAMWPMPRPTSPRM
jgi:cobalt-zinc-cadmium resistance protein CzcA